MRSIRLASRFDFWDKQRQRIHSSRGGWRIGQAVWNCGYSMMDDLVGKASYFQVLVLSVTRQLPEKRLADWIEASFICLSWPDPRIWCNAMGALAGSARVPAAAAVSAGILASDSMMYASGAIPAGCRWLLQAFEQSQQGMQVAQIVEQALDQKRAAGKKPVLMGFARPIASGDERVIAMERVTRELGFEIGPHLSLALQIDAYLQQQYGESINMLGYSLAFLLDQGFSAEQLQLLYVSWVQAGVHACYAETRDKPAGSYLPMRCQDVRYVGPASRSVPQCADRLPES